ncbi:hypothetical protein ACIQWV_14430 [Streptomyces sp. NPDC098085]|uniref:hypothetical protein n=1 Tax=Streptomyces sp. NPDC098085 TaxID=3366094 RepID=UPI00380D8612
MSNLALALHASEFDAEIVGCRDDKGLKQVDRSGAGQDRALAGGEKYTKRLALTAASWVDEVFGRQGLPGRADGIKHVGLAARHRQRWLRVLQG